MGASAFIAEWRGGVGGRELERERHTFSAGIWEICVKRPWRSASFWSTVDRFVDTFAFILICASSSSLSHAENQVSRLKTGLSLFTLLFSPILEQILRSLYWLCLSRAAQLSPTFMLTPKHVCVYVCEHACISIYPGTTWRVLKLWSRDKNMCCEHSVLQTTAHRPVYSGWIREKVSEPPPPSQAHIWILKWKSCFFLIDVLKLSLPCSVCPAMRLGLQANAGGLQRSCTWRWWPVGTGWRRLSPWSNQPSSSAWRGSPFTSLLRTLWHHSLLKG